MSFIITATILSCKNETTIATNIIEVFSIITFIIINIIIAVIMLLYNNILKAVKSEGEHFNERNIKRSIAEELISFARDQFDNQDEEKTTEAEQKALDVEHSKRSDDRRKSHEAGMRVKHSRSTSSSNRKRKVVESINIDDESEVDKEEKRRLARKAVVATAAEEDTGFEASTGNFMKSLTDTNILKQKKLRFTLLDMENCLQEEDKKKQKKKSLIFMNLSGNC